MSLFAADALTAGGWMRDVRIEIAADGTIARGLPGAKGSDLLSMCQIAELSSRAISTRATLLPR